MHPRYETQGSGRYEHERPFGGSYGYGREAHEYGPPERGEWREGRRERQRGRRTRRRGMIRRFAGWLGSTLQEWAERSARQFERAGERAREWSEEGGERAQRWADRGEERARQMRGRAGEGIRRAGEEMEDFGREQRYGGGRGESGYGYERSGWGGRPEYGFREGHFVGRGPKGYRRSDERIREDVCEELFRADLDATDIEVRVEDGEVILEGTVPRRRWKRMAEDLIEEISGVREVQNRLRMRTEEEEAEAERHEPRYHSEITQTPH